MARDLRVVLPATRLELEPFDSGQPGEEPGTGVTDRAVVLGWLSAEGYDGRLGLGYSPTVASVPSMGHCEP